MSSPSRGLAYCLFRNMSARPQASQSAHPSSEVVIERMLWSSGGWPGAITASTCGKIRRHPGPGGRDRVRTSRCRPAADPAGEKVGSPWSGAGARSPWCLYPTGRAANPSLTWRRTGTTGWPRGVRPRGDAARPHARGRWGAGLKSDSSGDRGRPIVLRTTGIMQARRRRARSSLFRLCRAATRAAVILQSESGAIAVRSWPPTRAAAWRPREVSHRCRATQRTAIGPPWYGGERARRPADPDHSAHGGTIVRADTSVARRYCTLTPGSRVVEAPGPPARAAPYRKRRARPCSVPGAACNSSSAVLPWVMVGVVPGCTSTPGRWRRRVTVGESPRLLRRRPPPHRHVHAHRLARDIRSRPRADRTRS